MAQEGFIVDVLIVLLPFIGDIACYETQNIMNHGVHHSKDSTDRQTVLSLFALDPRMRLNHCVIFIFFITTIKPTIIIISIPGQPSQSG